MLTDKFRSHLAAKSELIPSVEHATVQYENNRSELSHQPARQQEKQMRRFKAQEQRFLSFHSSLNNLSRLGSRLFPTKSYRIFRDRPFAERTRGKWLSKVGHNSSR